MRRFEQEATDAAARPGRRKDPQSSAPQPNRVASTMSASQPAAVDCAEVRFLAPDLAAAEHCIAAGALLRSVNKAIGPRQ